MSIFRADVLDWYLSEEKGVKGEGTSSLETLLRGVAFGIACDRLRVASCLRRLRSLLATRSLASLVVASLVVATSLANGFLLASVVAREHNTLS